MGLPIFFIQKRPGLGGRIFSFIKFRTMKKIDKKNNLLEDAERITRVGAFLRN